MTWRVAELVVVESCGADGGETVEVRMPLEGEGGGLGVTVGGGMLRVVGEVSGCLWGGAIVDVFLHLLCEDVWRQTSCSECVLCILRFFGQGWGPLAKLNGRKVRKLIVSPSRGQWVFLRRLVCFSSPCLFFFFQRECFSVLLGWLLIARAARSNSRKTNTKASNQQVGPRSWRMSAAEACEGSVRSPGCHAAASEPPAGAGALGRAASAELGRPGQGAQSLHRRRGFGARLHQPSGHFATFEGLQGTLHWHPVGFRGKPQKQVDWAHHSGSAVQTDWRLTQMAQKFYPCEFYRGSEGQWRSSGRQSTMRTTSGAARARHATARLGRTPSWWQQHKAEGKRQLYCCWTWQNSTNRWSTTTGRSREGSCGFPLRLLAFWRWTACSKPSIGFGAHQPSSSDPTTTAKLMLADLFEIVAIRFPSMPTSGSRLQDCCNNLALEINGSARTVGAACSWEGRGPRTYTPAKPTSEARTNSQESGSMYTKLHRRWSQRCSPLGFRSGFYAHTTQVGSGGRQGGTQAKPELKRWHHHASPLLTPCFRAPSAGHCCMGGDGRGVAWSCAEVGEAQEALGMCYWCSGIFRADTCAGLERTVRAALGHPWRHDDRPARGGPKDWGKVGGSSDAHQDRHFRTLV